MVQAVTQMVNCVKLRFFASLAINLQFQFPFYDFRFTVHVHDSSGMKVAIFSGKGDSIT
jgi:hypothetical protein